MSSDLSLSELPHQNTSHPGSLLRTRRNLLSLNSYHYRRGGSDTVYFEHAKLLEQAGWTNTFFSMHHPSNLPCKDSHNFADLVDWEFAGNGFARAKTAFRSVYNFDARSKLRKLLAVQKPDIAHVHCIYHHLTPAVMPILDAAGIPIILTAHDLKLACPAYKMMNSNGICERCKGQRYINVAINKCIKNSFLASSVVAAEAYLHRILNSYRRYLTKVICPSQFYRDKLIEWGWDPSKLVYIPNFVDDVETVRERNYKGNLLYFGRLAEEKGLRTLVLASARASVPVDIVGAGPQRDELQLLITRVGAPVRLRGRLDGDALRNAITNSRAVVLPSEWYENAPMSVLEAMQLARPIIGASIGGIPELLGESGAGVLFTSGSIDELAAAMTSVWNASAEKLAEMGSAGEIYVRREFSRNAYLTRMLELYSRCLAGDSRY